MILRHAVMRSQIERTMAVVEGTLGEALAEAQRIAPDPTHVVGQLITIAMLVSDTTWHITIETTIRTTEDATDEQTDGPVGQL